MGAPGSGKDTQVNELKKGYDLELISSGDLARNLASKNPEIEEIIKKGDLIPDEKFLSELEEEIKNTPKGRGFILDGFPRTIKQAMELEKFLFRIGKRIDAVIYLNVSEEVLVERLSKRMICPKCGQSFYKGEKECPKCGVPLIKRPDDRPKAVSERIAVYMEKTIPVIEFYKSKGLIEINGDQSVEEVASDITSGLGLS